MFIRFELGCHHWPSKLARWHGIPLSGVLCPRCDVAALDDEQHMVFGCLVSEDLHRTHRELFGSEVALDMHVAIGMRMMKFKPALPSHTHPSKWPARKAKGPGGSLHATYSTWPWNLRQPMTQLKSQACHGKSDWLTNRERTLQLDSLAF